MLKRLKTLLLILSICMTHLFGALPVGAWNGMNKDVYFEEGFEGYNLGYIGSANGVSVGSTAADKWSAEAFRNTATGGVARFKVINDPIGEKGQVMTFHTSEGTNPFSLANAQGLGKYFELTGSSVFEISLDIKLHIQPDVNLSNVYRFGVFASDGTGYVLSSLSIKDGILYNGFHASAANFGRNPYTAVTSPLSTEWNNLKFVVDMENKKYSILINGFTVADRVDFLNSSNPALAPSAAGISGFYIMPNIRPAAGTDATGMGNQTLFDNFVIRDTEHFSTGFNTAPEEALVQIVDNYPSLYSADPLHLNSPVRFSASANPNNGGDDWARAVVVSDNGNNVLKFESGADFSGGILPSVSKELSARDCYTVKFSVKPDSGEGLIAGVNNMPLFSVEPGGDLKVGSKTLSGAFETDQNGWAHFILTFDVKNWGIDCVQNGKFMYGNAPLEDAKPAVIPAVLDFSFAGNLSSSGEMYMDDISIDGAFRYTPDSSEINIIKENFISKVTNGQNPNQIFSDLNLIDGFTLNGEDWEVRWEETSDAGVIDLNGVVSRSTSEKKATLTAKLLSPIGEAFAEQLEFTLLPNGEKLLFDSFESAVLDGDMPVGWNIGDGCFGVTADFESNADNFTDARKILRIESPATFSETASAPLDYAISYGVVDVYLDFAFSGGEGLRVGVDGPGGNGLTLYTDRVEYDGGIYDLGTVLDGDKWHALHLSADLDAGTLKCAVNGAEVFFGKSFATRIESVEISAAHLDGFIYADGLLVYAPFPDALGTVTYASLLDGQHRWHVERDLVMPAQVSDAIGNVFNVEWTSTDTNFIKTDGTVQQQGMSSGLIKVNATVYDGLAVLSTKTFEFIVAPKGSSLVMAEDFNGAPAPGAKLDGYKLWAVSTNDFVDYTLETAPDEASEIPFASADKALRIRRYQTEAATVDNAIYNYDGDPIAQGKVEVSFDLWVESTASRPVLRINSLQLYLEPSSMWGDKNFQFENTRINHTAWTVRTWQRYKLIFDFDNRTLDFYLNGVLQNKNGSIPYTTANNLFTLFGIGSNRKADAVATWYFDNYIVRTLTPPDEEAVQMAADALTLPANINADIDLPARGEFNSYITWQSSDTDIISLGGIVNRGSVAANVTLTANIRIGGESVSKQFDVIVAAESSLVTNSDIMDGIAKRFSFNNISAESPFGVTENLNLITSYGKGDAKAAGGVTVSWNSDNTDVISASGQVTPQKQDTVVNLTARFSKGAVTADKIFRVVVLQSGSVMLYEPFDTYGDDMLGDDISEAARWSVKEPDTVSTANSVLLLDPFDAENKVLQVRRKAIASGHVKASDERASLQAGKGGKSLLFTAMFLTQKNTDVISVNLTGVGIGIRLSGGNVSVGGIDFAAPGGISVGQWHQLAIAFDGYNGFYNVYIDGKKINNLQLSFENDLHIETVEIDNPFSNGSPGVWYVDDIMIRDTDISDLEAVTLAFAELMIQDVAEWDIEDLPLICIHGTNITWKSSDESILTSNGVVYRTAGSDKTVTLTARIARGGEYLDKPFVITVPGLTGTEVPTLERLQRDVDNISVSELTKERAKAITSNLSLFTSYSKGNTAFYGGMTVEWQSEFPFIIDEKGVVARQYFDVGVTLIGTFYSARDRNISVTRKFDFIVLAEGEVLYFEDFEDIAPNMKGKPINGHKGMWTTEYRLPIEYGQDSTFEADVTQIGVPFAEANKTLCVDRWAVNTDSRLVAPQRNNLTLPPMEGESYIVSFDLMFDTPATRVDFALLGASLSRTFYIDRINVGLNENFLTRLETKKWYNISILVMTGANVVNARIDGRKSQPTEYVTFTNKNLITGLQFDSFRSGSIGRFYVDNIMVRELKNNDEAAVSAAHNALALPGASNITNKFELPGSGLNRTVITWETSNEAVINNMGEVTSEPNKAASAILTAYIRRGAAMRTKPFPVTVNAAARGYEVKDITVTNNEVKSVTVQGSGGALDACLLIEVSDKGKLIAAQAAEGLNANGSITLSLSAPISLEGLYNCTVKAYVKSGSETVSNVKMVYPEVIPVD